MLKKMIISTNCLMFLIGIQSISIAQNETAQVKDSTAVQTTTTIEPLISLTIPEGTKMMVNINNPINTHDNPAGSTFKAILDADFTFDGKVISPKGSTVYGKIIECRGGRVLGGSKLTFQFTDIMVNNQLTSIVTDPIGVEGGQGNTAKTVGAGALIGAAFGGAGEGAAIAGGLALLKAGKNHIQVPAGTLAEVPLKAPLTIK